jgi:hypothetical protein
MVKWLIVWGLERACTLLDGTRVPFWRLGYHCQLANLSADLDERWHTGVWHAPTYDPNEDDE